MDTFQLRPTPVAPASGPELGAFALGTVFTLVLAGLASVQTLDYLTCAFFIAPKLYLGLAVLLLAAGLLQASFCLYTLWLWFVQGYGNVLSLSRAPWSYIWSIFLFGFIVFLSHAYFAWQVAQTAKRFKWAAFSVLTTVASFAFALALAASVKIDHATEDWTSFQTYRWYLIAFMWSSASTSLTIAGALCYSDIRGSQKSVNPEKGARIIRLLASLYRANGAGCLVAFVDAVLVTALSFRGWHNLLFLPLIQLYISAVVTSLEYAYTVKIEALDATTSTSPSTGLHNSHLRSDQQRSFFGGASRSGQQLTEVLEGDGGIEAKKDSSTQNGSTTEVGSVSEKDSITASPTFALRSVVTHCVPIRIPNHPYAVKSKHKEQSPTSRHPYAAPGHEEDY